MKTLTWLWDGVLYALIGVIAWVLFTGGAVVTVGGLRVSMRTVTNPLILFTVLAGLRLGLSSAPLLAFGYSPQSLSGAALGFCESVRSSLREMEESRAWRWLALVVGLSALVKIGNIVAYYGFITGDDVEVQEMAFATLFHWKWTAWNLRNAIYPIGFLYPGQQVLVWCGVVDPGSLIMMGRLVVAAFSSCALWLVYVAAREMSGRAGVGLLAASILAVSKTHVRFASTELPRSVAVVFLLAAFVLGLRHRHALLRAVGAGLTIAVAGVLRFSEFLYVGPEIVAYGRERRWLPLAGLCASFTAASLTLLALGDLWYWGDAFFSFRNVVQYTLVERQSSRGFQPWHFYLSQHASWSNVLVIAASLWSWRLGHVRLALWTWLPVVALSALPHKEARYMVPVLPFLCIGAALGVTHWLEWLHARAPSPRRNQTALALVAAALVMLAFEMGGWRFPRSEDGVDLARSLASQGTRFVVAEQSWRLGGRLYLQPPAVVVDLSPEQATSPALSTVACAPEIEAVALRTVSDDHARSQIGRCGFTRSATEDHGDYTLWRRSVR